MSTVTFGKFGSIPFEQFVEQVETRLTKWGTVPAEIQNKQYHYICKYLEAHSVKEVPQEQWQRFSKAISLLANRVAPFFGSHVFNDATRHIHQIKQIVQRGLGSYAYQTYNEAARYVHNINQVARRELCVSNVHTPLLLQGPGGREEVVSAFTFDDICGHKTAQYRTASATCADKGTIDLTDLSPASFQSFLRFLSDEGKDPPVTAESAIQLYSVAHRLEIQYLQAVVADGCTRFLKDALEKADRAAETERPQALAKAQEFVEEVIGPIALLDEKSKQLMLPALISSQRGAKYSQILERALRYDLLQCEEYMKEISRGTTNYLFAPFLGDGCIRKTFSLSGLVARIQHQYPHTIFRFPGNEPLFRGGEELQGISLFLTWPSDIQECRMYPLQDRGTTMIVSRIQLDSNCNMGNLLSRTAYTTLVNITDTRHPIKASAFQELPTLDELTERDNRFVRSKTFIKEKTLFDLRLAGSDATALNATFDAFVESLEFVGDGATLTLRVKEEKTMDGN